jgi:hypothetical protein
MPPGFCASCDVEHDKCSELVRTEVEDNVISIVTQRPGCATELAGLGAQSVGSDWVLSRLSKD